MADTVAVTKVIEIDVKASANAQQHLKDIANSTKTIEDQAQKAGSAFKQLTGWVKGFVGFQVFDMIGGSLVSMASALQEVSDRSKVLEERMKLVTTSTEEAGRAFSTIIDISIRQGRELDGVAKLYERVQRNSDALGLSQKGVALITEGVAASLRLSGTSTQEANAAMLQFSQALASGKLGGDEFRSLMENNSVLMQEFAKALGTTMGGLRDMSREGKLSAETMREAMLKMGDDGRNMLQRMIEQAAKLPKTFDQSVAGAKAALTDLVNALQQTGDKSEGIFTKIVRKLTESMREAATRLRDFALINEEVAKRLNKELSPKEENLTFEQRYMRENVQRASLLEEQIKKQEALYELTRKANKGTWDQWDQSLNARRMRENIEDLKGQATAVQMIISRLSKEAESAAKPLEGLITGPVTTTPTDGKKPKGDKQTTAKDVIEKIRSDIQGETVRIQSLMEGESKARSALEEKLLEIEKVQSGGMSKAAKEDFKAWARQQTAENDALLAEMDRRKQEAIDSAKRLEDFNKEVEKSWEDHRKAVEKIRDDAAKDRLTQDPFVGAEAEVERLKAIMWDERTSDEMVQIIADRITQIRTRAAKQLLGEKDPLKTVPELMADSWEGAFARMEYDLLDFSKSAKDIVLDLVETILVDFARLQLREAMDPLMQMGKDFMKGIDWGSLFGSKDGSLFEYGVRKFGLGGIVDQPTGFTFNGGQRGVAGEAGTEAIMPVKRGSDGKLGVGAVPVQVIVNNYGSGSKVTREERTGPSGEQQIVVTIEDIVETSIGSGRFDSVMGKSYGLNRRGT